MIWEKNLSFVDCAWDIFPDPAKIQATSSENLALSTRFATHDRSVSRRDQLPGIGGFANRHHNANPTTNSIRR
ncbi:hypothetical protein BaRGS_00022032 [Batillaria attramentaria]|uniref:Uncharacterized protein n=1 Tax=Batillaria attramentaria TaxID=370345 RepID=A0ABD0KI50_9CAEN